MRSEVEVNEFEAVALPRYTSKCKKCGGTDRNCSCWKQYRRMVRAYEACIPRDFWDVTPSDITHNEAVFKELIQVYASRLGRALKGGYGLILLGDNGVGKTIMMSYVLMRAIDTARTVYYTTMPQLDWDIKSGFSDPKAARRLQWLLTSDFLCIDELGKERKKRDSSFSDQQIERILKQRFDDSQPVLIGTNLSAKGLEEAYGGTIGSILHGKFQTAQLEPGDFRDKIHKRMTKDMGM